MGRGDRWESSGGRWSSQDASRPDNLWNGAKHARAQVPWKKGNGKGKAQVASPAFPAYDAKPPSGEGRSNVPKLASAEDDLEDPDMLVSTVQKALNGARKSESRLARLLKDRQKAEQQWQEYMRDSKAAYIREKERHSKALAVFATEIATARENQSHARMVLRQVAFRDDEPNEMQEDEGEHEAEWEQMVLAWEQEQVVMDDGVLRRGSSGAALRPLRGECRIAPRCQDTYRAMEDPLIVPCTTRAPLCMRPAPTRMPSRLPA